jgi:hypothetical protein
MADAGVTTCASPFDRCMAHDQQSRPSRTNPACQLWGQNLAKGGASQSALIPRHLIQLRKHSARITAIKDSGDERLTSGDGAKPRVLTSEQRPNHH